METSKLPVMDLHLFDAAGAPAAGAEAGQGGSQEAEAKPDRGSSRRGKEGAYAHVVFGKQPGQEAEPQEEGARQQEGRNAGTREEAAREEAAQSPGPQSQEARRKAFEELIQGEYKDLYAEKFQQAFNRRFKEVKGMEQTLQAQKPVVDMLMQRYRIGDGDVQKLLSALEKDDVYWAEAADQAGLTVEQYKTMQKLERENQELRQLRQKQLGQEQAKEQLNRWYREAEQVKSLYPAFDLRREAENRDFLGLLKAGIPVQKAYELIHMEEIKENAARQAAQRAGEQVVAKLKSKAARPLENGTSSQSAVIVKNDVSHLSRADRAEIARRVQRGETIAF